MDDHDSHGRNKSNKDAVDPGETKRMLSEAGENDLEGDEEAVEELRSVAAEEASSVADRAAKRADEHGNDRITRDDIDKARKERQRQQASGEE